MVLRTSCMVPVDGALKTRCGKDAGGRHIAKCTHHGQTLSHFICAAGHVFHTDETCHYYFECDCRPHYAQMSRSIPLSMNRSDISASGR